MTVKKNLKSLCLHEDCGKAGIIRNYCSKHYYGLLNSGQLERVRNRKRRTALEIFNDSYVVNSLTGCWEWTGPLSDRGYAITFTDARKRIRASRFSCEFFKQSLQPGQMALHECDNPVCVCPDHIYAGTAVQNIEDMMRRNRHWTKTEKWEQIITPPMAMTIRILYARGTHSIQILSDIHLCSYNAIHSIVKGLGHLEK